MSYKKLEIWKIAREISVDIQYLTLNSLPKFEMYEEGAQIRRSSKSIRSNIVEGYGRRYYKHDFIRFLIYSHASVLSYTEITKDNLDSFHFHGNAEEFPVDVILVIPKDHKSGIMLRGRYEEQSNGVQILVPIVVINDLLDTVASVKNYILAGTIVVGFATLATTLLVFILSIRLRQSEIITIRKIGGTRRRVNAILATEIIIVVTVSVCLALLLTIVVNQVGMEIVGRWLS